VYVSAHYELKTGKYFGGAGGVKAGETWTQDSTQATGRYRVMFIGSKVENEDFVCPKPSGWRELGD
jgi:hypothetical protein